MKTDEWKPRNTKYDTRLEQRLNVKDEDLAKKITDLNGWNMLSLDDFDKVFFDNINEVIDDKFLPHIKDVKLSSALEDKYLKV